jgi:hypothetical protein
MELAPAIPGAVRIGDYIVDHALAFDTSEACYLAQHALLPRRARVRVAALGARRATRRLLREAWVLEALGHPGVPRLYDCAILPRERAWSAIEPIEGDSLATVLATGPLPIPEMLRVVRGIAEVLAHAHALGIVHGRVRAESILLRDDVLPALVDWRDARLECVDGSGDVLGLGIIAYRALTGHMPAGPATGPASIAGWIEAMLAPGPLARPSAAAIAAEAARFATPGVLVEEHAGPVPEVEDVIVGPVGA